MKIYIYWIKVSEKKLNFMLEKASLDATWLGTLASVWMLFVRGCRGCPYCCCFSWCIRYFIPKIIYCSYEKYCLPADISVWSPRFSLCYINRHPLEQSIQWRFLIVLRVMSMSYGKHSTSVWYRRILLNFTIFHLSPVRSAEIEYEWAYVPFVSAEYEYEWNVPLFVFLNILYR